MDSCDTHMDKTIFCCKRHRSVPAAQPLFFTVFLEIFENFEFLYISYFDHALFCSCTLFCFSILFC